MLFCAERDSLFCAEPALANGLGAQAHGRRRSGAPCAPTRQGRGPFPGSKGKKRFFGGLWQVSLQVVMLPSIIPSEKLCGV